jgi:hypothetical protein
MLYGMMRVWRALGALGASSLFGPQTRSLYVFNLFYFQKLQYIFILQHA